MKKTLFVVSAFVSLSAVPLARADVLPPDDGGYPDLPPIMGGYESVADYHANYDNVLRLDDVFHWGFLQHFAPPSPGYTATHSFGSYLDLSGAMNTEGGWVPFTITGVSNWTTVKITGSSTPGDYSTEMLGLNVSIPTPFGTALIRESPTSHSTGHSTFTDAGGGNYTLNSFFDVFTELSVDGGDTWIPADSDVLVQYICPEPASTALGLLGIGLVLMCRRGHKA